MTKYLIYFSYLGTRFSGLQKQPRNITVQGVLEHVISMVLRLPENTVRLFTSSRTDAGVHALMNTATVVLPPPNVKVNVRPVLGVSPDLPFDPVYLQAAMNHLLWDLGLDTRVIGCRIVADGFCPRRHAKLRTYLYRLAVLKPEFDLGSEPLLLQNPAAIAPLVELGRSWPVSSNFRPELFAQASKLFVGGHNFASFMNLSRSNDTASKERSTMRYVKHIGLAPGQPMLSAQHEPLSSCFDYYDVEVVSKSFLYKQIRRMVCMLVAVAHGRVQADDIRWLLNNPHPLSWEKYNLRLAPPGGLYLKRIEYDASDFENPMPAYGERAVEAPGDDGDDQDAEVSAEDAVKD